VSPDPLRPRLQLALGAAGVLGDELAPRAGCRVFEASRPGTSAATAGPLRLLLHPAPPAGPGLDALRQRVEAFAALRHRGLVLPLGVGEIDGRTWVLESVAPPDAGLLEWAGMVPVREGVDVFRELARVLAAVHRRGLTHGAVDAEFVWLEGGEVRLAGSGLVTTGTIRADLDQLAALVWTMLAGSRPTSPQHVLPLSRRRRGVPPDLDRLFAAMLSADVEARPQRAETLLDVLDALPASVPDRVTLVGYRGSSRPQRSAVALVVLMIVAVVMVTLLLLR
jgi:hypothetical protein